MLSINNYIFLLIHAWLKPITGTAKCEIAYFCRMLIFVWPINWIIEHIKILGGKEVKKV